MVEINAESRVKVDQGSAKPELVEAGTRVFLVKVINHGGVTAPESRARTAATSTCSPTGAQSAAKLTPEDAPNAGRHLALSSRHAPRLSGLALEYQILEIYSRDAGQRSAKIGFNVGQGTQDIGFRNDVVIVFNALPASMVTLRVKDEKGQPAMARSSSAIDSTGCILRLPSGSPRISSSSRRSIAPMAKEWCCPAGYYTVEFKGGPEYSSHTKRVAVNDRGPSESLVAMRPLDRSLQVRLVFRRPSRPRRGLCALQNPAEGVEPKDMMRQIAGERLNVGCVLTWGPCYYYQKQFFSGKDDPLRTPTS